MGGDKPQALLGGKTLLQRSLDSASVYSETVALAVGPHCDIVVPPDVCVLTDAVYGGGPIFGLWSAFKFGRSCRATHVLTLPCDAPFLPGNLMVKFLATIRNANVAVAVSNRRLHPICAMWRLDTYEQLTSYLLTPKPSLRGFAAHIGFRRVIWSSRPVDPFFNVNSKADLALAEQLKNIL